MNFENYLSVSEAMPVVGSRNKTTIPLFLPAAKIVERFGLDSQFLLATTLVINELAFPGSAEATTNRRCSLKSIIT